jgi:hypothetical protein
MVPFQANRSNFVFLYQESASVLIGSPPSLEENQAVAFQFQLLIICRLINLDERQQNPLWKYNANSACG